VIGAVVAELHLHRAGAGRQAQDLVPQTDAEYRQLAGDERARRRDRVAAGLGIPGAVGEQHAVRLEPEDGLGRGLRRHHGDAAIAVHQHAQDVALDAKIVDHHVMPPPLTDRLAVAVQLPGAGAEGIGLGTGHDLGEVGTLKSGAAARRLQGFLLAEAPAGHDAAVLGALVAQDAGEAPGVDPGDGDHPMGFEIGAEILRGAEIRRRAWHLAQDQPGDVHLARLGVLGVGAHIADVRVGQGDDLLPVGGIGEDLLIAGHRRVEDHLAGRLPADANGNAFENRAISECEQGRFGGVHRHGGLVLIRFYTRKRGLRAPAWFAAQCTACRRVRPSVEAGKKSLLTAAGAC
jgi:hypothetical protein